MSLPFDDASRYDMIADIDGDLLRVQVKTASIKNGCVHFATCSSSTQRGGKKKSYAGQVEIIAAFSSVTGKVYWVPISEASESEMNLRISKPKKQTAQIKWAQDYEIQNRLGK